MIEALAGGGWEVPSKEEPGTMRCIGALDVFRMAAQSGLPTNVWRVVQGLTLSLDAPTFEGKAWMAKIAAESGYCMRHARRSMAKACELGILERQLRPWAPSRYRINVPALYRLAEKTQKLMKLQAGAVRDYAARALEAAAAGVKGETMRLPGVADLVQATLGADTAARMGWTQGRAWRLWEDVGRPDIASWGKNWQMLSDCGLRDLHRAPGWLWHPDQWRAKVADCHAHVKLSPDSCVTPIRGAEWAFPQGSRVAVDCSHRWSNRISPQRALALLQQTDAAMCLPVTSSVAVGWQTLGRVVYLVVHVGEAAALAVANEAGETLLDKAIGPFVVTW